MTHSLAERPQSTSYRLLRRTPLRATASADRVDDDSAVEDAHGGEGRRRRCSRSGLPFFSRGSCTAQM
jgi:hypothetical protein